MQKIKKYFFKNILLSRTNRAYIQRPALKTALQPLKTDFLLITLAFNDLELIKLQKTSLKKVQDEFDHVVADNSSRDDQAKAIEIFCMKEGIGYVRLPQPNPGIDRSLSHGFSLNWIFDNMVKKLNPGYFGFLESDVLVATPGSFLQSWKGKDFWGLKVFSGPRSELWRLWPGFCFFCREFYQDKALNFLPVKGIDTGGGNIVFLRDQDVDHLIPWSAVTERMVPGKSGERIQVFANVVHLVGMSIASSTAEALNEKRAFAKVLAS